MGCLTHQILDNRGYLEVTLFLTMHVNEAVNFRVECLANERVRMECVPDCLERIEAKKQKKVLLKLSVQEIPFHLPEIKLNYVLSSTS